MKNLIIDHKQWLFFLILFLIGLVVSNSLLRSTPHGMGLVNDTGAYVNGAANLLEGHGYMRTSGNGGFKPITTLLPMFSFFLAFLGLLGFDIFQ